MKQNLLKGSLIPMIVLLSSIGCKKASETPNANQKINSQNDSLRVANTPMLPYPVKPAPECNNAPNYGDSIAYPQPTSSSDYYVYPVNNQGVQGTYLAWPGGLVLDPQTGSINMTKSQTGQRYDIAFVKSGTTDTCMSQMIVAGGAYMDSVYVLANSAQTAKPYFNANPFGPAVCVGNQGQGCQFDYNNQAKNQGIEIDQNTGFIDLQKTMRKSPFGLLPINGTTVYTTINYKLNDNSNFAPQSIQLQMVYYNHLSDVPSGLLSSVTNKLLNVLSYLLIDKKASSRPPLIIIVRSN